MEELNALYIKLLGYGLVILREAIYGHKDDWAKLEVEMLHNIPSLIGEGNTERHSYYWNVERDLYIERVFALIDEEPKSKMRIFYEPVWQEMEPIMLRMFESKPGRETGSDFNN